MAYYRCAEKSTHITIYALYFYMIHYKIAKILIIVGGLNWGLIGITHLFGTHFDLVEYIGYNTLNAPIVSDIVYVVVGIAALIMLVSMLDRS